MNITLTVEQSGLRADQYLAGVLDGLTRSAAQKLLGEGRVLRRGKVRGWVDILPIPFGRSPSSDPGFARPTFPLGEGSVYAVQT